MLQNATVWLNGKQLGEPHLGGYSSFSFDLSKTGTATLLPTNNELIVKVYDPSDQGYQPAGKQRISAISGPSSDTYTPSSGIWQTVWFEEVPALYIESVRLHADTKAVHLTADTQPNMPGFISVEVSLNGTKVAAASGSDGQEITIPIPNAKL